MSRRPKPHYKLPAPLVERRTPPAPTGLGRDGKKTWAYVWKLHWIVPERHLHTVRRYCELQDLIASAVAQVEADGFMIDGSKGQRRCHPALTEIRQLATEARRTEVELALTPGSESKAGVSAAQPRSSLDDEVSRRRRLVGDAEESHSSMATLLGAFDQVAGIDNVAGLAVVEGGS